MTKRTLEPDREKYARVAAECVGVNLRKASRAVTQVFDEAFRPAGLRGTQFTVLIAVGLAAEATMTRLAEALVMDRTTLTRNLRPLERLGWVKTVWGTDRRTRTVELTQKGREKLRQALPLWERAQARVLVHIGPARWRSTRVDLSNVIEFASVSHGRA